MVSFASLLATLGLFAVTSMASPAPLPETETDAISTFDFSPVPNELATGLEARQEKACLAFIGLGPPSNPPFCGLIGVRPNTATHFRAATGQFPTCDIVVEVAYPNCAKYRVVSVVNCGGERQIDIRETDQRQGCP